MVKRIILAIVLVGGAAGAAIAVQQRLVQVEIVAHVLQPQQVDATPDRIARLEVPAGFQVTKFADGLGKPRMLAVADDGAVYVTRREPGDILVLRDTNRDGRADEQRVAVRRPMLHGIAFDGRRAFFIGTSDVFAADVQSDGTFANVVRLAHDLPVAGQHADRTIAIGPDKFLYLSVGSTCNACDETSPENATIERMSPDGQSREILASGLRNTIGFAWHPDTRELYGMDNGIDFLGDEAQPEELNHIERGKRYGWPYVYADGKINPQHSQPPGEVTAEEWAKWSTPPELTYTAHAAPMQMLFYQGRQFPADYRGDAFVAMHGSWNRRPPSGYEVVRIRFQNGKPSRIEPFLTGFLSAGATPEIFGRPVGVAVAKDGALLVADDTNGVIYRVVYRGAATTTAVRPAPETPPAVATSGSAPAQPLAIERRETQASGTLTVTSSAFRAGGAIPEPYTQYGDNFSPALSWSGAPPATRTFALLMEDPDAKQPKPYVHWILYGIPATTTSLHESIPTVLRLREPKDARQGRNSRGSVGYVGSKPPERDPIHHYHFEVFALDSTGPTEPAIDRDMLLQQIQGHVLARGEIVGTFQRPGR
jgi:Raf kinase inhibitor-like YbhB/YbcL family protein